MTSSGERTVGLIGCGTIGGGVIRALTGAEIPGWQLGAVLATSARTVAGFEVTADPRSFFQKPLDLIIEAAGPAALAQWGEQALGCADVWAVSGTALTDEDLRDRLQAVGEQQGHRLRLIPGAIAGLDGVGATTVADDATAHVFVDLVPGGDKTKIVFNGTVRDAAARFPNHVNVTMAAALSGLGLDRTEVTVRQPKAGEPHTIRIETSSRDGSVSATTHPVVRPPDGIHIVASALIAALRAEGNVIWVG